MKKTNLLFILHPLSFPPAALGTLEGLPESASRQVPAAGYEKQVCGFNNSI
jgi:hypothetical protein